MKKIITILSVLLISFSLFSRPTFRSTNHKIAGILVKKLYRIYKTKKYKNGLKITTGSMHKRFKKLYDFQRMNRWRVPAKLNKLSNMLSGFHLLNLYSHKFKNKEYIMVNCVWVMKYRDTTAQSMGIAKTKWVVRAYLVKKDKKGIWKVSSEKFITEYLLRGEEHQMLKKIYKKLQQQRMRRRRRGRRSGYSSRYRRNIRG